MRLPDLASRIRATHAVGISPPEDSLLRALLSRLFAERQLAVPPGLQDWLLLRLPRDAGSIREAVRRLDCAALAEGARVTRGLAIAALGEMIGGDNPDHSGSTAAAMSATESGWAAP
jgi:chromosomal replication initiation ATPase DnaA